MTIPSRVLGQILGEAVQLCGQVDEVTPYGSVDLVPKLRERPHLRLQVPGAVRVYPLGQLVHILEGKPQGLAQVACGPLQLVGAHHSREGGAVPAPPVVHPYYQLLPDVAGKVQVDIRDRCHVLGQEALQGEVELQGIDVREADQVAHQHRHRRAPSPARRPLLQGYLGVAQAQLDHYLPGELDDVVVDQKEAGQVVLLDQGELLPQPRLHLFRDAAVSTSSGLAAQVLQVGLGSESLRHRVVGEAVAQVPGQVEGAAVRYTERVHYGVGAIFEQRSHLPRRLQIEVGVGPPLAVGLLQRPVVFDGHQGVLEPVPLGDVVVDVVGGYYPHSQVTGQLHEAAVSPGISLDQVTLQLHEDVGCPEPLQVPPQGLLGLPHASLGGHAGDRPPGAPGEHDQALSVLRYELGVQLRTSSVGADVGVGDEPAQVAVSLLSGREKGQVGAAHEGELRPGDGVHSQAPGHLGELHGPAQVVVVGEGQGRVAQLPGSRQELANGGGPLPEGVVAVAVQLDVGHIYTEPESLLTVCLSSRA